MALSICMHCMLACGHGLEPLTMDACVLASKLDGGLIGLSARVGEECLVSESALCYQLLCKVHLRQHRDLNLLSGDSKLTQDTGYASKTLTHNVLQPCATHNSEQFAMLMGHLMC